MTALVDIWVLRITGAALDQGPLSPAERERAARYQRPEDAALSVGGALLVRTIAGRALGVGPAEVRVERVCPQCGGPHGVPRVAGAPYLSVAHCSGSVLVAACAGHQVGVDVEDAARSDIGDVTEQLLAPAERRRGLTASDLLRYWVRKEAVVKATGIGLYADLRTVLVSPPDAAPAVLAYGPDPEQRFALADVELPGVLCSVALLSDPLTDGDLSVTVHDGAELLAR
ncbi:4'-phosphopantetheinyl transferase family protein [Nocardioides speluncae]|uniref:4'-phosphopantetheinyl transferase family protein n=1 Tax=Nocardioides speluncae TaxID=2670337 RepID=UPI000D6971E3|nr:4'-phosphopantetheinyl transferase superfamily protein [Nocardioides speluncae]